jgi:hypothetical protein
MAAAAATLAQQPTLQSLQRSVRILEELVRYVARAFYDSDYVIMLDALVRYKR